MPIQSGLLETEQTRSRTTQPNGPTLMMTAMATTGQTHHGMTANPLGQVKWLPMPHLKMLVQHVQEILGEPIHLAAQMLTAMVGMI